ncbi:1-acyl-sn-glycerol-3-phosphate acyltransferase [Sphingobium sp. SYK-6]|uniref:lysophospholipid acyltransferase family protein n=1 Tax=Sphingobium sp. (strain NBRC 103272 / SYK-6) TaxID=627192 RepID=UPI000227665B|nr:lysophospholipid acyltransferase family protein [Sphingobium sp. SYK-6]BAK65090.1 1-acyl-sn-glycerol-3-phosphate acyltransferase [Sphingobium sp. SYK-6]
MPPLSPPALVVTFLRSVLFALLFYCLTVVMLMVALVMMAIRARTVAPAAEAWARMHRLLVRHVLGQKIVVEGRLPDEPRFIVCKHESMFETLDALCLFRRPVIAAKAELGRIPVWGAVARAYGLIIVDRNGGASALRAIRTKARAAFAAGRPVIFYPEGTRVPHGECPDLRSGFAGLYAVLDCPVVPIAVDSGRLSPRNSFLKRAGTITYRIGEVIPTGLPRAEAEARVHAAINALNREAAGERA